MTSNTPFLITFGPFEGKYAEQLIWLPGKKIEGIYVSGYEYLRRATVKPYRDMTPNFIRVAQKIIQALAARIPIKRCQCGSNPAQLVWVAGNESGCSIGPIDPHLYCRKCEYLIDFMKAQGIPLVFSAIMMFKHTGERRWFIRTLKYVYYGDDNIKITTQLAISFLYEYPLFELSE